MTFFSYFLIKEAINGTYFTIQLRIILICVRFLGQIVSFDLR